MSDGNCDYHPTVDFHLLNNTVQGGVRTGANVQVQYLPYNTQVRNTINTVQGGVRTGANV